MNNLTDAVSGNLGKALEEVDKLLRNPRTRVEIITLNRQMKTVTTELGTKTLELYKVGRIKDVELAEICARIVSIEARIVEREAKLAAQAQQVGDAVSGASAAGEQPCPRCNTPVPADAVFCQKCGLKMEITESEPAPEPEPQGRFCPQCGRELRAEAKFCPRCGSSA